VWEFTVIIAGEDAEAKRSAALQKSLAAYREKRRDSDA